jgi:hypothetical protein
MIVLHPAKFTIKQIENISDECESLGNIFYTSKYSTMRQWWRDKSPVSELDIYGSEIALKFGKQNCNMKGYESYPGAWVFRDTVYAIDWLVFSDGIRRGHYKGTSYELRVAPKISEDDLKKAITKFFAHFGYGV